MPAIFKVLAATASAEFSNYISGDLVVVDGLFGLSRVSFISAIYRRLTWFKSSEGRGLKRP